MTFKTPVNSEHQTIPGGEILMDGIRKTIRIEGEFKDAEELKTHCC